MISDDATSRAQSGAGAEAGGDGLGWDGFAAETGIKFFFSCSSRPGTRPCSESHSGGWEDEEGGGRAGGGGRERDERRSPSAHKRAAAAMIA